MKLLLISLVGLIVISAAVSAYPDPLLDGQLKLSPSGNTALVQMWSELRGEQRKVSETTGPGGKKYIKTCEIYRHPKETPLVSCDMYVEQYNTPEQYNDTISNTSSVEATQINGTTKFSLDSWLDGAREPMLSPTALSALETLCSELADGQRRLSEITELGGEKFVTECDLHLNVKRASLRCKPRPYDPKKHGGTVVARPWYIP